METEDESPQLIQNQVLNETLNGISCQKSGDTAALCCVICLSEITEPCSAQPCTHHNFDFLCLTTWLEQKPNCPLCKATITDIQYDNNKTYKVPPLEERERQSIRPLNRPRFRGRSGPSQGRTSRFRSLGVPTPYGVEPSAARLHDALERRRHVYRHQLLSLHVGSNPSSRYREVTPSSFESDPNLLSRARSWIRRELQVFEFLQDDGSTGSRRQDNAEFVLEYVIAVLKTVDLQSSNGHAVELLRDFLGRENARVFVHELRSFLRSPYSVEGWDRNVQYRELHGAPSPRRAAALDRAESDEGSVRAVVQSGAGRRGARGSTRRRGDQWSPRHSLRGGDRWEQGRGSRRGWRMDSR